ncbi:histidine phosphatase family protein [Ureibacillus aquaedulcis]|uniref:Histidine phosphatase family protein n=1 Tax=Ureibacillus aquaedulcis TaxID=3058421 RepID=A0ABT8GMG4_9BACL|nr:histidine phosphatase family protein [Ureibacillus sp. BA0131]MDN4492591.1 histidine phosphatase family protein [Ureibacillus sp. BA0131]
MDKTVYLVRHCHAEGEELHAELTEEGKEQAAMLMRFFQNLNIRHIISSPFTRAIQTLKPTADSLNLKIEIDERLTEHKLISKNLNDWLVRLEETVQDKDLKMESGVSSSEVAKRGMELLEAANDGTVLATHRNTLALILMRINGMQVLKDWAVMSQPDVYEVKVKDDIYSIKRIWG